jgi:hypothetical protein
MKSAGELLSTFMDRDLAEKARVSSGLFRSWRQVAGERLSAHSRIVEFERGTVFVEADHPSWIQLLQMRQEEILLSIKNSWPELQVRGLAFRLANADPHTPKPENPGAAAPAAAEPTSESSGERDDKSKENSEENAGAGWAGRDLASIKDERLRGALERLRKSVGSRGPQPERPADGSKIDEGRG